MPRQPQRSSRRRAGASRVVVAPQRDWSKHLRWGGALVLLAVLGAVLPSALVAVPQMPRGPLFPLHKVEVTGDLQRLDSQLLRERLLPGARGGFFDVDVQGLRQRVAGFPWVAAVQISRRWPDQLVITITEREPVARWRSEGLLDSEGKFFSVEKLLEFSALPLLAGPDGSESEVFAAYQFFSNALVALPRPVNEVELDGRGVWRLRTMDGVELVLRGTPQQAPLARLLQVYQDQLMPHWDKVRSVDTRYSDGLAVAFAPNTVQVEKGSSK